MTGKCEKKEPTWTPKTKQFSKNVNGNIKHYSSKHRNYLGFLS
jgi:hypothetical protein